MSTLLWLAALSSTGCTAPQSDSDPDSAGSHLVDSGQTADTAHPGLTRPQPVLERREPGPPPCAETVAVEHHDHLAWSEDARTLAFDASGGVAVRGDRVAQWAEGLTITTTEGELVDQVPEGDGPAWFTVEGRVIVELTSGGYAVWTEGEGHEALPETCVAPGVLGPLVAYGVATESGCEVVVLDRDTQALTSIYHLEDDATSLDTLTWWSDGSLSFRTTRVANHSVSHRFYWWREGELTDQSGGSSSRSGGTEKWIGLRLTLEREWSYGGSDGSRYRLRGGPHGELNELQPWSGDNPKALAVDSAEACVAWQQSSQGPVWVAQPDRVAPEVLTDPDETLDGLHWSAPR